MVSLHSFPPLPSSPLCVRVGRRQLERDQGPLLNFCCGPYWGAPVTLGKATAPQATVEADPLTLAL